MSEDTFQLELPVLLVGQPIGEFYISSISARDLVEIAFADVRRLASEDREVERYLGIQRPLSKKRVREIRKYIEGSDATFPTAVIVAVDENCAVFDEKNSVLILSEYEPEDSSDDEGIPWGKIAKVLDGQHRIAAFMNEDDEYSYDFDRDFEINLAIFVGADISEQANIFATVNLAQTKVNRSLVYDLTELARTRSPHKTCHNVAVALDGQEESPLYQRIKRLGTKTPGRSKEPLTQAAFVESLVRFISVDPVSDRQKLLDGKRLLPASNGELSKVPFRNMFLEKRDVEIAEILFNYFSAVENKWPGSWNAIEKPGNLLPKSNAFKALMKYLKEDVYPELVGDEFGYVPSVDEFESFFVDIDLKDSDFTSKNFVPGSGGQSMFLKMLRREVKRKDMIE